jgi:hypothetical protein
MNFLGGLFISVTLVWKLALRNSATQKTKKGDYRNKNVAKIAG